MCSIRTFLFTATLILAGSSQAMADVLLLDSIGAAPAITTPQTGLNMASVRTTFGEPASEDDAIGEPPITRWNYPEYSVFFEYDLVLHSVIHRPQPD